MMKRWMDVWMVVALTAGGAWAVGIGQPAPDFTLKRWDTGEPVTLSQLKGKVVFLNFFAMWCGPCVQETPALVKVEREYRDKGVVFLSVDVGEKNKNPMIAVSHYVKTQGVSWPIVMDAGPDWVKKAYGARYIPFNFVINAQGVISYGRSMGMNEFGLRKELDQALGLPVKEDPGTKISDRRALIGGARKRGMNRPVGAP